MANSTKSVRDAIKRQPITNDEALIIRVESKDNDQLYVKHTDEFEDQRPLVGDWLAAARFAMQLIEVFKEDRRKERSQAR